jgi:solute carrier family 25 (mitochondrial folate transporter), member 32
MTCAVLAGAVSDVICNPMFVVRTRLQTEALHHVMAKTSSSLPEAAAATAASRIKTTTATGMLDTIKLLYIEGGLPIFWRGMSANLIGLSHAAVQFPTYEMLKKLLKGEHKRHESALDLLLASGLSKMTASLLTYPHEVVRSRMMDARAPATISAAAAALGGASKVGLISTCQRIYATEGLLGFYSGLHISLIRVIPNTCITFLTYELILRFAKAQIEESRQRQQQQQQVPTPKARTTTSSTTT